MDNKERARRERYRRTPGGVTSRIHAAQKSHSKTRGMHPPSYTPIELRAWIFSQENWEELFSAWVSSAYDKWSIPSIDRINNDKPYTLDNIRLTSWLKNYRREVHNKERPVIQITLDGMTTEHPSILAASKKTGIFATSISLAARNPNRTSGNCFWRYA